MTNHVFHTILLAKILFLTWMLNCSSHKITLLLIASFHPTYSPIFFQEVPIKNPVYLMLGASFGSAAKGTGLKALEFALSICDSVDMYGFTVDPGYKEWYEICCYE